jgi:hypothetical protein
MAHELDAERLGAKPVSDYAKGSFVIADYPGPGRGVGASFAGKQVLDEESQAEHGRPPGRRIRRKATGAGGE